MNPTEADQDSQELSIALLTRHRWMGNARRERYICTPGVPSLYESSDPICFGCGAEMSWKVAVPNPKDFKDSWWHKPTAEALGVRLDLRYCELRLRKW